MPTTALATFAAVLSRFRSQFTAPTFVRFILLVVGWLLAWDPSPGARSPVDLHWRFLWRCERAALPTGLQDGETRVERQWKKLPPSKRLEMRRQRAGPVIEMLKRWKDEQLASSCVGEGSRLREALNYLTNQWTALGKFLHDGQVPIHNNESERQLRSLVVGRANWLFVGSDDTAEWTCTFVSLVASCQIHGLDPEGYLRDLFRVLPVWPKTRMLELAPKFWRATRALLDPVQLARPLGPLTVPPARPLRRPERTRAAPRSP